MNENTHSFNSKMKRNSTLFLAAVAAVNVGYWGWRYATHETLESCLIKAAQAANGAPRAYADLREICENRELERQVAGQAGKELTDKQVGLFDDLPKAQKQ
jgi:hypothetical protein